MQTDEFIQQLWIDYIHHHPDIESLRLWPLEASADYLATVTLNHGPYAVEAMLPALALLGYRCQHRHAMADRGLLVSLMEPPDDSPWLLLAELQLASLSRRPRDRLDALVNQAHQVTYPGMKLMYDRRPWPMPNWDTYLSLHQAHPLAGWLAVMGPRMHHAGFDCDKLGMSLSDLDTGMQGYGLVGDHDRHHGIFPVSPLLDYAFYPTLSQRLAFAEGDEHRIMLGGLALIQKQVSANQEGTAELLLPHHTRCEMS